MRAWKIWSGIALLMLGFLIPVWLRPQLIELDLYLQTIYNISEGNQLMLDAFYIVSINTIISTPQFFSLVMIGEGLEDTFHRRMLKTIIPIVLLPAAYVVINNLTPLTYSFGATDNIIWVIIIIMQMFSSKKINIGMKLLVLSQLIFGITWLNQVSFLTRYGFGLGSLSAKLKEAAIRINFVQVLDLYANVLFVIFVSSAVVLWIYLVLYTEKWAISQELHRVHMEAQETRSGSEVLHLVHDLKTPLSSVAGLVSLIELRWQDPKMKEYCQNIYGSINIMNKMISEMLYEDHHDSCEVKELMDYIRASLSGSKTTVGFEMEGDPHAVLYINKIRVTRAVVNLIDNAFNAISTVENGHVILRAIVVKDSVKLEIEDNGKGIPLKQLKKIWKSGYSTKSHLGIGLAFVKQIAQGHNGSVHVKSEEGKGTKIWIILPIENQ